MKSLVSMIVAVLFFLQSVPTHAYLDFGWTRAERELEAQGCRILERGFVGRTYYLEIKIPAGKKIGQLIEKCPQLQNEFKATVSEILEFNRIPKDTEFLNSEPIKIPMMQYKEPNVPAVGPKNSKTINL